MPDQAPTNEALKTLQLMSELLQKASHAIAEGADVEGLCEEARKLAELWDQGAATADVAASAISRHSSGGIE